MREPEMRRAFSSHWGGSGEGEERDAHALKKQQKHRWKWPCGKSGCQQTKLEAGNHCLPSLAPGQGDCSVNKLAMALTAWKLIWTRRKQQIAPFYPEQRNLSSQGDFVLFCLLFFVLFCFAFLENANEKSLTRAAQVKGKGRGKRGEEQFHFMYQWFRTSFRANHTRILSPTLPAVGSHSRTAWIATWKA